MTWSDELVWAVKRMKGRTLLSIVMRLAWRASIYYIWRERNRRMHGHILENADQLMEHVKQDVRIRTTSLQGVVNDSVNSIICHN